MQAHSDEAGRSREKVNQPMFWGQGSPRPGTGVADLAQAETKGDAL